MSKSHMYICIVCSVVKWSSDFLIKSGVKTEFNQLFFFFYRKQRSILLQYLTSDFVFVSYCTPFEISRPICIPLFVLLLSFLFTISLVVLNFSCLHVSSLKYIWAKAMLPAALKSQSLKLECFYRFDFHKAWVVKVVFLDKHKKRFTFQGLLHGRTSL